MATDIRIVSEVNKLQSGIAILPPDCDLHPCLLTIFVEDIVPHKDSEDIELPKGLCALEDVESALWVFSESHGIFRIQCESLPIATAFVVGLLSQQSIDYALTWLVINYPKVIPNPWIIALFDYQLKLDNKLYLAVEEYMLTGIYVNSKAQVLNGEFDPV
jgi:hypothetical protein